MFDAVDGLAAHQFAYLHLQGPQSEGYWSKYSLGGSKLVT